jgi:hypothetical protein
MQRFCRNQLGLNDLHHHNLVPGDGLIMIAEIVAKMRRSNASLPPSRS